MSKAEELIKDYIESIDDGYMFRSTMAQRAYRKWASTEILERIKGNPYETPLKIAEDFWEEMCGGCSLSMDSDALFIFSIAKRVAEDIIDILYIENL